MEINESPVLEDIPQPVSIYLYFPLVTDAVARSK